MKYRSFYLWANLLGAAVLLFIAAPLAGIVLSTDFKDVINAASEKEVSASIWLTIIASIIATLLFAALSLPFAWLLARKKFIFKRLVTGIIDLPVVIPHTAAGIALLGIISRNSPIGRFAGSFGIDFVGHPSGIIIAMAFVSLPFFINSARDGFSAVPERLEKAALNLGASPARVFITISVPLAMRQIISGCVMMFARGMSEFGAVVVIAYHPMVAPVLIYERFSSFGLQYARPVAVIMIVLSVVFFLLMRLMSKDAENARN
ncbi:MAG: molybdate/tungstate transport system permease protein [Bacteroidetes bacterium]|nr:MAG: molybdate/tungstate transport system permease protein [Bacteroidota bacterium]